MIYHDLLCLTVSETSQIPLTPEFIQCLRFKEKMNFYFLYLRLCLTVLVIPSHWGVGVLCLPRQGTPTAAGALGNLIHALQTCSL